MAETAYSVAASVMRFFFVALLAFILINTAVRCVVESSRIRRLKKAAGLDVRYIEILAPEIYSGRWYCVDEGCTIGSGEECDVSLPKSDLSKEHANIRIARSGIVFSTRKRRFSEINGIKPARHTALADGDTVWIRDVSFVCHKRKGGGGHENEAH